LLARSEHPLTHADLLALNAATSFVMTDSGRILHGNAPDRSAGPRLYIAGCKTDNIVLLRHDVGAETARAIEALVADEPPLDDPERPPVHLEQYIELLASEAPVQHSSTGLNWYFPERLDYRSEVRLVASGTLEGERLLTRLASEGVPKALAGMGFVNVGEFWWPWCVALHENEIASIAFAARLGQNAAATGVATLPGLRGRGFATAATAGWASLPPLRDYTLFYGADRSNTSSRHVAERLGLHFLGPSVGIT
jgi:hypothetical protein